MNRSTNGAESTASDRPRLGRLFEALSADVVLRFVAGRRVLDLGHGSAEVRRWVQARTTSRVEVVELDDLHPDEPDLGVSRFESGSFEVVYSLSTFPHLGTSTENSEQMARAFLRTAADLTASNGFVLVQIANPSSLWGIAAGVRHSITAVAGRALVLRDETTLTRCDTLSRFARLLPPTLEIVQTHGIGVLIPHPRALSVRVVGRAVEWAEWRVHNRRWLSPFGAHLLVVCRRLPATVPPRPDETVSQPGSVK